MKKRLKSFILLCGLGILFITAGAQEKNYGTLVFKKEDILKYYDAKVDIIVFKYIKPLFSSYKLEGTPFDKSGNPVLKTLKLNKVSGHNKERLENLYKGVLILYVKDMKEHDIDGKFDVYLIPQIYDPKLKYVSYLINNKPVIDRKDKGYTSFASFTSFTSTNSPAAFTSFSLNPSPPYKPRSDSRL